jgi:hypothetical protein
VSLSISCIDRLYVNGYMPALQNSGQLCDFMRRRMAAWMAASFVPSISRRRAIFGDKGSADQARGYTPYTPGRTGWDGQQARHRHVDRP